MSITIKSEQEIEIMRQAGKIVARTHSLLAGILKPGMTTLELDKAAEEYIRSQNAKASFKGYSGYPASICVSINDEVVHGIPGLRQIQEGDLVSIDIGAYFNGYHSDAARSYVVGQGDSEAVELVRVAEESFFAGIRAIKPGAHLHEISHAIQKYVESHGFSVVRDLVGHGIGRSLHEEPQIPNYKPIGRGPKLQSGMVLAIEPMVNAGKYEVRILDDDWTVVTLDGTLSAHYENTVLVTEDGCELLTVD
ncbi:type I methionyl aminopeptidase [Anaerotalea alkaliphila]|uniref:Methionine aminopeptidase n=1 Tax=Anaerotalea alkaliphila TaxID=2662126 RepID=A0A7X5KMS4_9FIRM|nr:type I methionyl aminopeptidase [Anaerotalea alkaliphila]NDL68134.1 type I methionyl aminopeptidase [Anaerotalea alkaliphila]